MSNAQTPSNGKPVPTEADAWSKSLMGRTEEVSHVQAQVGSVTDLQARAPSEPPPVSMPGTPAAAPAASARGLDTVPRPASRSVPATPPPAPPRPLAAALRLGSAGFGLVAAVLLVLPEARRLGEAAEEKAPAPVERTLAPSFDTAAPAREGAVSEQRAPIPGTRLLMAESEPSGATVSVDGVKQGTTPLTLTLECTPGAAVRVKFARKGYEPVEHATACDADTMTRLSTRLRKSRGGGRP